MVYFVNGINVIKAVDAVNAAYDGDSVDSSDATMDANFEDDSMVDIIW